MLTLTPGMTAPEGSVTRPVIVDVPIWANATTDVIHRDTVSPIRGKFQVDLMGGPPIVAELSHPAPLKQEFVLFGDPVTRASLPMPRARHGTSNSRALRGVALVLVAAMDDRP